MDNNDAIVNPLKGKNSHDPGSVVVMVSNPGDFANLCKTINQSMESAPSMLMSRICIGSGDHSGWSVVGPVIGAPYAVILMENLIAWGVSKIIYFGLCGAISDKFKIGDIIIPTGAISDEGTSRHYNGAWAPLPGICDENYDNSEPVAASKLIVNKTKDVLSKRNIKYKEGLIWTTDAIYRETAQKVDYFLQKEAVAVEMEMSALFSVGIFRNVDVGGVLVVSDELSGEKWKSGFGKNNFKKSCQNTGRAISDLCRVLRANESGG